MSEATKLATEAGSRDPTTGRRAVAESLQVDNARRLGWSWQEIATTLGVSKQAVHKKHAERRLLRRRR